MADKSLWEKMAAVSAVVLFVFLFAGRSLAGVPASPGSLSAVLGNGEATLSWPAVEGAASYVLYGAEAVEGPFGFVARTRGRSHTDRGLANDVWRHYRLAAVNGEGQGPFSPVSSVRPSAIYLAAPGQVAATPGNGEISLSWNPVASAVSYNVYRAAKKGGPYAPLSPAAPGPSFTDRGLANGTRYFYVVQTLSTNAGAYSEEASAAPSALLAPAPENVSAAPGSTWARVSWDPVEGADSYAVYRGESRGGPHAFQALSRSGSFDDVNLINGTTYFYVVAAVNGNGRGAFSGEVSAAVAANQRPKAPVLMAVKTGSGCATLSWETPPGAVSFKLYRGLAPGGPYTDLGIKSSNWQDCGLANGTTYYYVLDALNASPVAARSQEVVIFPVAQMSAPALIRVIAGNTEATVNWTPVPGATGYWAVASLSPGGDVVASGYAWEASSTMAGLTNGQPYYFRVQSMGGTISAFSNELSATPSADLPLAPTNFNLYSLGNTQGSIHWNAVPGATGYDVYRRTGGAPWPAEPLATIDGTLFTDSGLENRKTYYYVVAARNESGPGAWTPGEMPVTPMETAALAPTGVQVVPGNTQATVTWNLSEGVVRYLVRVSESRGGHYFISAYSSGPSFKAGGLTNGTAYYFRVQSGGYADSASSVEVVATPSVSLPLAPVGVGVTWGNGQMSVTWSPVEGATGYNIYRRKGREPWPALPVGSVGGTMFNDSGLENGTGYYYAVAAVNQSGEGAFSDETPVASPDETAQPAPQGVAVLPGNTQATALWNPVPGANGYLVTVAGSPGGVYMSGGSADKPCFTAAGLTNGLPYYFRVQALGGVSCAYSDEASVVAAENLPMAPGGLSAVSGNTQASLVWGPVDGASGYRVFRTGPGKPWPGEPAGTPEGTLHTDQGLGNGGRYWYAVAAANDSGPGAWSQYTVEAAPSEDAPLAPANVSVAPGNGRATVQWGPSPGADCYYVTMAESSGGPGAWGSGASVPCDNTSFTAVSLENGRPYWFRVQAQKGGHWSAFSPEVFAIPFLTPGTGVISGNLSIDIAGYQGLGVRNATVLLLGTNFETVPDPNGGFAFSGVPFGEYTLSVSALGLAAISRVVSLVDPDLQLGEVPMGVEAQEAGTPGDVDGNGTAGVEDAVAILQWVSGKR
ncbi:MAG: fibronectin type III domain-containing protein [Proteobacteria bacterium]|nr:fibronectin type III domain-containing protein [Pseudomonadota bacterium]